MQRSEDQSFFKAFLIIVMLLSVIAAGIAVFAYVNISAYSSSGEIRSMLSSCGVIAATGITTSTALTACFMMLFSAIIDIVVCVLGLQSISHPERVKIFVRLCVIAFILSLVGICITAVQGAPNFIEIMSLIMEAMMLAFAVAIK